MHFLSNVISRHAYISSINGGEGIFQNNQEIFENHHNGCCIKQCS